MRSRVWICTLLVLVSPAFAEPSRAQSQTNPPKQPPQSQKLQATDLPLNLKKTTGQTADWLRAFAPEPQTFTYTIEPAEADGDFLLFRVEYPSPMVTPYPENNTVPAELYLPKNATGPVPAAIVLDILDGRAILPRIMARALAARGVAALYFPMPFYNSRRPPGANHLKLLEQDFKNILAPIRQTVMDARRAKAILAARPEIDPKRIGITGISLGGIMTTLCAGVDGEFYRVAPIMAGGDLATITFHCREMRGLRQILIDRGIAKEDFAKLIAPADPLTYASRIDPASCLMINASLDEVIPKITTLALRKMIGDPTILWMPTGHYTCALFLPNAEQKVAEFMLGQDVKSLDFSVPATQPAH